jgi:hypothetical protein
MKWIARLLFAIVLLSIGYAQIGYPKNGQPDYQILIAEGKHPGTTFVESFLQSQTQHRTLSNDFTLLGKWRWGACWTVAIIDSHHVIIGNGELLQILDISGANNPVKIGEVEIPGTPTDITVMGNYAYAVGNNDDLDVIDLSDLTQPTLVSHWTNTSFNSFYFQITHDNRGLPYLYLGGTYFTVVDISNPLQPHAVAELPIFTYIWLDIAAYTDERGRSFIYTPNSEGLWLEVFDVTDPTAPVSYAQPMPNPLGVCIVNDYLYVGSFDEIRVYSLDDPQALSLVGEVSISPLPYDLATDGESLYAGLLESDSIDSLSVRVMKLNLADPTSPTIVDSLTWPGPNSFYINNNWLGELAVLEQKVFVASSAALWGVDFDDPRPQGGPTGREMPGAATLFYYPTGYGTFSIRHQDELGFIASGPAGLWILDLSDLASPQEIGHYPVHDFAIEAIARDSIAFLTTLKELKILNIAAPSAPQFISEIALPGEPYAGMEVSGGYLYIPSVAGLLIVDISDLSMPQIIYTSALKNITDVAIYDTLAFITRGNFPDTTGNGLHILNISNPASPEEISVFNLWGAKMVAVDSSYSYAYVATTAYFGSPGYNGFAILDVRDPANPTELSRRDTLWSYSAPLGDLKTSRAWAYLTRDITKVIEISDKLKPKLKVVLDEGITVDLVKTKDQNDIIILDHSPGISIYRNDIITGIPEVQPNISRDFQLFQNYPNPFNPQTTIEFYLPRREKITIEIFNSLGQKVKTLLNKAVSPGRHRLTVDLSTLPSGVYLYRLKTPEKSLTRKMVLLQ